VRHCSSYIVISSRRVCVYMIVSSGQSSAVADFNLLDTARKVELYGIQMHPAKVVGSFSLEFSCLRALVDAVHIACVAGSI